MHGSNLTSNETIDTLLSWCDANGIEIDPRIEVVRNEDGSISVYTRDALVETGATRTSWSPFGISEFISNILMFSCIYCGICRLKRGARI